MANSDVMSKIDAYFRISARGSTFRKEICGGIITFLAMVYILVVNPSILSGAAGPAGYTFDQLFTATALAAIISCLLMGIYSRFPVALAPGMGVNAFLSFTICGGMGFTFEQGLLVVLISGILFIIITVTGIRAKILDSIPKSMKLAISAGIGFFIALIGLSNAGIISNTGSPLTLGPIADPGVLLGIFCIVATLVMWYKRWWFAVIAGMIATWVIGLIMGACDCATSTILIPEWNADGFVSKPDFELFGAVFTNFDMFESQLFVSFIAAIVSLFVVDVFDTAGTLIGVGQAAGLVDENGHLNEADRALTCDAVATIAGAVVGTSTTTSFIESTTGIDAGARTGLMPVVVAILFGVALFFSGFFGTFTSACTVGALVLVGILMIKNVKDIEWEDPVTCVMAFLTIFMMGLAGSITDGIAFGIFAYVIGKGVTGKIKEVTPIIWVLTAVFVIYFFINYAAIPNGWL